ncbi:galactoside alpha-(1,2)-fucosyltransferase 2-like [Bufo gargarizans]|uniref:galactoside alpha-(1,2)-fucosyltransferase 2-like n=1 Tax=Bufo gargarizans TaxID=30331 RepID=UPI001CF549C0|nr:galactoside alpha-(1,2)-fucosyltransferase 2-like [Bufo gargarizans]
MTFHYNNKLQQHPLQIHNRTNQELTGIWTIEPTGRLGNLMGEYATLYALAKLNGHKAYVLPKMYWSLSGIFKITLPLLDQQDFAHNDWINLHLHDWMSPEYEDISKDYVKLTGYPCSWTFYEDVKDEILREFTFHDSIKEKANNYLSKLQEGRGNVTFVGVHVRRGDYLTVMPKVWKGVVADRLYLQTAMSYFREKYQNPLFIVTSNGMDWCKKNIDTTLGDVHFSGDGKESSPTDDFALLAHCNHTIMTIGTFGYWAGYLAKGETIYLSNFTLPDSKFLKIFKYEAAFLPDWIGIPADLSPLLN